MEIEFKEGEALTAEQIKDLAEKVRLAEEFKTKYEQSESQKAGLVEELKEEKRKKQEAADLARAAMDGAGATPEEKILSVVEKRLAEEKTKQIEMSRSEFEANFKATNPEFEPSNDAGGIKFQAFKNILSKFNLNGLTTEKEFAEVYKDAMLLLKRQEGKPNDQSFNRDSFSPGTRSSGGDKSNSGELSSKEEKMIQSINWTKEKYLKLKTSRPDFVESLLSQVRD